MVGCGRRKSSALCLQMALTCCLAFGQSTSTLAVKSTPSRLGRAVQLGFVALREQRWRKARIRFELALRVFDSPPEAVAESKPEEQGEFERLGSYWLSMNGKQSLLELACFSAQLEGNDSGAQSYFDQVEAMRGLFWGKSWEECVRRTHRIFFRRVAYCRSPHYGKTLALAGRLLLDAGSRKGLHVLKRARRIAPRDPSVYSALASYLITHGDPGGARMAARASLVLKPDQPCVLMDLATAELVLARFERATNAARRAYKLNPEGPGPHGVMALVALERGDAALAVREAETANRLSSEHRFYRTILAVCLQASGDKIEAKKTMNLAWPNVPPSDEDLRHWFFRRKPLEYARQLR